LLASVGCIVEECGDVFRGLARMLRSEGDAADAAAVCVDALSAEEFEFFSILSRRRKDVPVFVYGAPHSEEKIERAIRIGAGARLTNETLSRVVARRSRDIAVPPTKETVDRSGERLKTSDGREVSGFESPTAEAVGHPVESVDRSGGLLQSSGALKESSFESPTAEAVGHPVREVSGFESPTAEAVGHPVVPDGGRVASTTRPAGSAERGTRNAEMLRADTDDAQVTTTGTTAPERAPTARTAGDNGSGVSKNFEEQGAAAEDEELSGPVRVPWLRYSDAPVRRPPRRTTPGEVAESDGVAPFVPRHDTNREDLRPEIVPSHGTSSPGEPPASVPQHGLSAPRESGSSGNPRAMHEGYPSPVSAGNGRKRTYEPLLTEEELRELMADLDVPADAVDRETGAGSPRAESSHGPANSASFPGKRP